MSKRETVKTKPTPTASEVLQAVKFGLHGNNFVIHTLCRMITEKTGCDYKHAETCAHLMLESGTVIAASKIGLTEFQTFKIADQ